MYGTWDRANRWIGLERGFQTAHCGFRSNYTAIGALVDSSGETFVMFGMVKGLLSEGIENNLTKVN